MRSKNVGTLLMVLTSATLAVAVILMKWIPLLTNLSPKDVAIWRFSIAAPLLWMVYFFQKKSGKKQINPTHQYMLLGAVFAVASFCSIFALDRLPSSLYVIVVYMYPSLVGLFLLITRKTVPKLIWIGLPVTFLGLFLVAFEFGAVLTIDRIGLLITLVNAFAMASYLILSEKLFKNTNNKLFATNLVMTGAMIVGLSMIPILGISMPDSLMDWVLLLSLGIFGTALPIYAMNLGLQLLGAARGSVVITLHPVLTVLFSTIFLGEILSLQQWLGGALVIAAIVILQMSADGQKAQEMRMRG